MSAPARLGLYKVLIAKMDAAIVSKAFLEASWLVYAILEDRLISILLSTGGADDGNGAPIWKMSHKIKILKERRKHDQLFAAYFPADWTQRVNTWKRSRDELMHAMANGSLTVGDLENRAEGLARNGAPLVFETCRQARQLKRNRGKIPPPANPYKY